MGLPCTDLFLNRSFKISGVDREQQVVSTDRKLKVERGAKEALEGLGFYFDLFKRALLLAGSAVRTVPIPVVVEFSALGAGNAPVSDFMQRTPNEVLSKQNNRRAAGSIKRLVCAAL